MSMSRAKAIREKCIDCCGGSRAEVRLCPSTKCALFPYRMGKVSKGEGFIYPAMKYEKPPQKAQVLSNSEVS